MPSHDPQPHHAYSRLLNRELVCALGCTEPIALAYAAAIAGRALGVTCEHLRMRCSGNIIKNVKSVAVPNAEGMKGVEAASTLGLLGGDPLARLEVLEAVTHDDVQRTRNLVASGFCSVELLEGVPNLCIVAQARGRGHEAQVTIVDRHTDVRAVSRDGRALPDEELEALGLPAGLPADASGTEADAASGASSVWGDEENGGDGATGCPAGGGVPGAGHPAGKGVPGAGRPGEESTPRPAGPESSEASERPETPPHGSGPDAAPMSVASIVAFAREVDLDEVRNALERQIRCNTAIADEGLSGHWGSQVGRTILATRPVDVTTRMRARAAAGSDARMGGCSLPVVINSGSGNQGMTCSLPVIEYARTVHASHDQLLRALCVSNLTAMHLKHYIGSLSAFCGVVCAAAGAGAAVTFLAGGTDAQIGATVVNTLANVGGIVCDGAKSSCAAKISSAVDAAMLGHAMAMLDESFCAGDGLVADDVETTIMSMGYVGRVGMHATDVEILNIMIGKTCPEEMRC